jgi:hypothetical protein
MEWLIEFPLLIAAAALAVIGAVIVSIWKGQA